MSNLIPLLASAALIVLIIGGAYWLYLAGTGIVRIIRDLLRTR